LARVTPFLPDGIGSDGPGRHQQHQEFGLIDGFVDLQQEVVSTCQAYQVLKQGNLLFLKPGPQTPGGAEAVAAGDENFGLTRRTDGCE
jgi:hypothetical protein